MQSGAAAPAVVAAATRRHKGCGVRAVPRWTCREKTQNMLLLSSDVRRVETWAVDFMANSTKLLQVGVGVCAWVCERGTVLYVFLTPCLLLLESTQE